MPEASFLENFHSLAEPDEEVRCRSAFAIKQALMPNKDGVADEETLEYAINRLIRGATSSRQCARHGYGLALSEILCAFPEELPGVVNKIGKETALPAGAKAKTPFLKEKLLGRMFAYAAVLHASPLWKGKSSQGVNFAVDLARGLHDMYGIRNYIGAPCTAMMTAMVQRLCELGQAERIPELLKPWSLDVKVSKRDDAGLSLHAAGLILDLRGFYEAAEKAGVAAGALKNWPQCVRENALAKPAMLEYIIKHLGQEMSQAPIIEPVSCVLAPFCRWWIRTPEEPLGAKLRSSIWPLLDQTLFPKEGATNTTHTHSFRVMGDLVTQLCAAAHERANDPEAKVHLETLLVGLFTQMGEGVCLMLRMLAWKRAKAYSAAVYANTRIVEALGADLQPKQQKQKQQKHQQQQQGAPVKVEAPAASPVCKVELSDKARLQILLAVQQHRAFGGMPMQFQKHWQQALLAPLSPAGVRSRCGVILSTLVGGKVQSESGEDAKLGSVRVCANQLEQLTVHGKAPDDVILAVASMMFTAAYLAPKEAANATSSSLKAFCSKYDFSISDDLDDVPVPLARLGSAFTEQMGADKELEMWRTKFWNVMTRLVGKPLPDMVEKLILTNSLMSSGEEDAGDNPDNVVKTKKYHGCFSDGTSLIFRLHQWWDYITSPSTEGAEKAAGSKKKGKKEAKQEASGEARCCDPLTGKDSALRKRCLELCRRLLESKELAQTLNVRKVNALSNMCLCMVFTMCLAEDKEQRRALRANIEEVTTMITTLLDGGSAKKGAKDAPKEFGSETFGPIMRLAAEAYVNEDGLVKEAARTVWREFGDCVPDETISSLSASIRDADAGEEEDGDEGDDDEEVEDDEADEADALKTHMFTAATEALRKAREAEKAAGKDEDDSEDEHLDAGGMLMQLLGDDEADGPEPEGDKNGALAAFASTGLEDQENFGGVKVTKKMMRLRDREEGIARKFRELDLVEVFLSRQAGKNKMTMQLLLDVHGTLMASCTRLAGKQAGEDENGKKKKRKGITDGNMRRLERALAERIAKMLLKVLVQLCRSTALPSLCQWRNKDEWATLAKELHTQGLHIKMSALGVVPMRAGALMMYLCCAAHATCVRKNPKDALEWTLGQEMMTEALRDWTSKKDAENWCTGVLNAFYGRVPLVLTQLPWIEQMRAAATSKKGFLHRSLLSFFADNVMRLVPGIKDKKTRVALLKGFGDQCAEMLENSCAAPVDDKPTLTSSQKWRMRREALKGAQVVMKFRKKKLIVDADIDAVRLVAAVTKVRDSMPSKRGDIYHVCLMVLRAYKGEDEKEGSGASKKRPKSEEAGQASKKQATGAKEAGGEAEAAKEAAEPAEGSKKRRASAATGKEAPSGKRRKEQA